MNIAPMNCNNYGFNYKKNINKFSGISFKQVTPEHFYIKMFGYAQDKIWGNFVADLANNSKTIVLEKFATVNDILKEMGTKYNNFACNMYKYRSKLGIWNDKSSSELYCEIEKSSKYGEYYQRCEDILHNSTNSLLPRSIDHFERFKAFQVQKKVDGKNVVLTQIGHPCSNSIGCTDDIVFIHPPLKSRAPLLNKAQKELDALKKYSGKALAAEDKDKIYEHIGAIHWCLAQGMPFLRGSAAMADVYTKSLFEALNIQVTPWKAGLSPDWEAFLTPLDEYSKKYKTFFE